MNEDPEPKKFVNPDWVVRNGRYMAPATRGQWLCQDGHRICRTLWRTNVDYRSRKGFRHYTLIIPSDGGCVLGRQHSLEYEGKMKPAEIAIRYMEPVAEHAEVLLGYTLYPNDERTISSNRNRVMQYFGEVWTTCTSDPPRSVQELFDLIAYSSSRQALELLLEHWQLVESLIREEDYNANPSRFPTLTPHAVENYRKSTSGFDKHLTGIALWLLRKRGIRVNIGPFADNMPAHIQAKLRGD